MATRNSSQVRSGVPTQLPLMKLNSRCSIGFHLLVPDGKWHTVTWSPSRSHSTACRRSFHSRARQLLLPQHQPGSATTSLWERLPVPDLSTGAQWRRQRTRACRPSCQRRRTAVVEHVEDAVQDGSPLAVAWKIMDVDRDGSMHQERPACLKSPISSFFCVSTLIIGCPAAVKVAICSSMWANWTSRSG